MMDRSEESKLTAHRRPCPHASTLASRNIDDADSTVDDLCPTLECCFQQDLDVILIPLIVVVEWGDPPTGGVRDAIIHRRNPCARDGAALIMGEGV